jgi:hypothetical protein
MIVKSNVNKIRNYPPMYTYIETRRQGRSGHFGTNPAADADGQCKSSIEVNVSLAFESMQA